MATLGEEGFMDNTKQIIECRVRLQKEVEKMDGLFIMGDPQVRITTQSQPWTFLTLFDSDEISAR